MAKKTVSTTKKKVVDPFAEVAQTDPPRPPVAGDISAAAPGGKRPRKSTTAPKRGVKVIKKSAQVKTALIPPTDMVVEAGGTVATKAADAFAEIASDLPARIPAAEPKKTVSKASKKRAVKTVSSDVGPALEKRKRAAKPAKVKAAKTAPVIEPAIASVKVEVSPVFQALADVSLPELKRENRARLMLQSPTKIFFYWSVRENPYQLLRNAFGTDIGNYTLVMKLVDLTDDTEKICPAQAEGNWWFTVEPDRSYRAEIGFYATNRPYFRIVYSNSIETPRRSPSPHPASEARWTVSATKFAEVLDVSGFKRDAIDVAIQGDEPERSHHAVHKAFAHMVGKRENLTHEIADDEVRNALVSFAGGASLEDMRHQVSAKLFEVLQANADRLTGSNAQEAIGEYFEITDAEWAVDRSSTVFGSSLIHFRHKPKASALRPVSS